MHDLICTGVGCTQPGHPPDGACIECGNDDPTEGYRVCSDCLEALGDPDQHEETV